MVYLRRSCQESTQATHHTWSYGDRSLSESVDTLIKDSVSERITQKQKGQINNKKTKSQHYNRLTGRNIMSKGTNLLGIVEKIFLRIRLLRIPIFISPHVKGDE